jgi:RNA polymerase sigma factor (sigma-70 family)
MNSETEHTMNNILVHRYQNGEDRALKLLVSRFHPVMIRAICYHTSDRDFAEDIAQECWYIIINKLHGLKLTISFNAWALTIVRRKSIDWIRDQQKARRNAESLTAAAASDEEDGSNENNNDKILEILQAGIWQLPPTQRIVLTMFYLENYSLLEISSILEISKGTVKSRLFYARENLKEIITKQHGGKR